MAASALTSRRGIPSLPSTVDPNSVAAVGDEAPSMETIMPLCEPEGTGGRLAAGTA